MRAFGDEGIVVELAGIIVIIELADRAYAALEICQARNSDLSDHLAWIESERRIGRKRVERLQTLRGFGDGAVESGAERIQEGGAEDVRLRNSRQLTHLHCAQA